MDVKKELERIFSPRGIRVENVLLSEISHAIKKDNQSKNDDIAKFYESRR